METIMKTKLIFCLAFILSGSFPLVAKSVDVPFQVVTEWDAHEIPEGCSDYGVITNQNIKLSPETFAVRTDLGWIAAAEYKRLKLAQGETHVFTPLGSKAFGLKWLTDSPPAPYEKMKAQIIIFQDGRPKYKFDFTGFKNFEVDWIDEKVLKIVSWPGTRVRVTELINVETGEIIYRSADGIYDRLKNSTALKK